MPVIGSSTASSDLGRRSMMAMKDGSGTGSSIPPDAFNALGERVRILEDRLAAAPNRAELRRAVTRAVVVGAAAGAAAGCGLAIAILRLIA
jgi:hypothetical protein